MQVAQQGQTALAGPLEKLRVQAVGLVRGVLAVALHERLELFGVLAALPRERMAKVVNIRLVFVSLCDLLEGVR